MAKKPDWDYALRIRGVTLKTLPVSVLAEYLREFAALIGDDVVPTLDGIVKGSVIVRIKQHGEHPALTRGRVKHAANDPASAAGRSYRRLTQLFKKNASRGEVIDCNEQVVLNFNDMPASNDDGQELMLNDVGTLDGCVISVVGADDTVHVRLLDRAGQEHKVVLRDLTMARELASRFRAGPIRVHVHGTWLRTSAGKWEASQVYADSFEDLDDSSAKAVFEDLRKIKTGWSAMADPITEWESIRGLDDLHA